MLGSRLRRMASQCGASPVSLRGVSEKSPAPSGCRWQSRIDWRSGSGSLSSSAIPRVLAASIAARGPTMNAGRSSASSTASIVRALAHHARIFLSSQSRFCTLRQARSRRRGHGSVGRRHVGIEADHGRDQREPRDRDTAAERDGNSLVRAAGERDECASPDTARHELLLERRKPTNANPRPANPRPGAEAGNRENETLPTRIGMARAGEAPRRRTSAKMKVFSTSGRPKPGAIKKEAAGPNTKSPFP